MSYHVYLLRLDPEREITREEWYSWMHQDGRVDPKNGRLKDGDLKDWLFWDQGAVLAQNPSEQIVSIMFDAAQSLQAKVVSDKRRPFLSVDDWREKTRSWRVQFEADLIVGRQNARKKRRKLVWTFIGAIALGGVLSWLMRRA